MIGQRCQAGEKIVFPFKLVELDQAEPPKRGACPRHLVW